MENSYYTSVTSLNAHAPVFKPTFPTPSAASPSLSPAANQPLKRRNSIAPGAGSNSFSHPRSSRSGGSAKKLPRGATFGSGPPRPGTNAADGRPGSGEVKPSAASSKEQSKDAYRLRQAKASKMYAAKRKHEERKNDAPARSPAESPPATPEARVFARKGSVGRVGDGDLSPSSFSSVSAPGSAPESPDQAGVGERVRVEREDACRALERDDRRLSEETLGRVGSENGSTVGSVAGSVAGSCQMDDRGNCVHVKAAAAANKAASAALEAAAASAAAAALERHEPRRELDCGKWCEECAGLGLHLSALVTQLQAGKPSESSLAADVAEEERKEKEKEKNKSSWKRTVSNAMINAGVSVSGPSAGTSSTELAKAKIENRRLEDENHVLRATVEFLYNKADSVTSDVSKEKVEDFRG